MISHYILLSSLLLGGIQGCVFAILIERHFKLTGVLEFGVFLVCFMAGVVLAIFEIETLRSLCQRRRSNPENEPDVKQRD